MSPSTTRLKYWNAIIFFTLSLKPLVSISSPTSSLKGDQALPLTWLDLEIEPPFFKVDQQSFQALDYDFVSRDASAIIQNLRIDTAGRHLRKRDVDPSIVYNNSINAGVPQPLSKATKKLFKIYPDVRTVYIAMALIPAFIICYGTLSTFIRSKLHLGEAMLAVTFGILLGPYVAGIFDPRSWGGEASFDEVTLEITRIIVALDVFSVGVELPAAYILHHWRTMICLLGPVMLAGWFITGAFILIFVPALSYLEALAIAACICPTDVLLASSVVGKGKYAKNHVPAHLRHMLQAEAGANDGIAILLLYLTLFILLRKDYSVAHAIGSWVTITALYHIMVGIVMGVVAGILVREGLKFSEKHELIDTESMVPIYISLALLTAGVCVLAGTDDIVAAFACGTAFGWDGYFSEEVEASNFSAIISNLVNTFAFIYVGATIPFRAWNDAVLTLVAWKMFLLVLSILLLRRLPIMFLLRKLIPELRTNKEALFCAHFGPIGVSGLFISFLATKKLPTPNVPAESSLDILSLTIQPILYLLIFCSTFIHGLSIPFFTITKSIRSRANSMRRSGSLSSGRPSFSRHRGSTSERPSLSIQRRSLSMHESGPISPIGPLSPLLPQVTLTPYLQPMSMHQQLGNRASPTSQPELESQFPGNQPNQSSNEVIITHATLNPIMCEDEATNKGQPLMPTKVEKTFLSPSDSHRAIQLTGSSPRNSVSWLDFSSEKVELSGLEGSTSKRTSAIREAEARDGGEDDMCLTEGCSREGVERDSQHSRGPVMMGEWESDQWEGEEVENNGSPRTTPPQATHELHACLPCITRPRSFSGRITRDLKHESRRISRVSNGNTIQEAIAERRRRSVSSSDLSSSPSLHCSPKFDSDGSPGKSNISGSSPGRSDTNELKSKVQGQWQSEPGGTVNPFQHQFVFTPNENSVDTDEIKAWPAGGSSIYPSPTPWQNLTKNSGSNAEVAVQSNYLDPTYYRMPGPSTGDCQRTIGAERKLQ
ncbi:Superoxide dismutase [Mn], mitochondrial [Puccinia graminis f. sp. tritici]|uniref:Superoxide dismutase [Mn], mitochondrial n=1 Tax=Puccinia graminis f. sp. tritici TaxID=56615 RepID=A0A5B0QHA6_PUCGR|nr:Superoxide dismutase [Mn], mitochondrial [Puccinia graminis f. sp. tritici]